MSTLFLLLFFIWSLIILNFFGPPVVLTPRKIINQALAAVNPQKNQLFIDLGCATGRTVRIAVKKYGVNGLGIDINPFLIYGAKLVAFLTKISNAQYKRENFFETDISKAEIIFVYLTPKYLNKIAQKIARECQEETIVISQRFTIKDWKKYLIKEIERKHNSTYIYKIR